QSLSIPTGYSPPALPAVPTRRASDLPLLGVLKPAGTPTVRTLMPTATGWKAVLELELSPGLKTAGLPTIVPTEGVPLVTGTFTVSPPRTACWLWMVRVFGSNIAGTTVSPVSVKRSEERRVGKQKK